ncbi:hypothetical protein BB559_000161 [Furculomyces boomerangus]|uniref:Phospholipid-transporting ATPase n=1 Tax=Furculomyces boomerangus TaxID=61424 RepID=A0A2T9Z630_9FUNG|nr:hypothetical protein BB559_000161 [Furculomyces boomerangus]
MNNPILGSFKSDQSDNEEYDMQILSNKSSEYNNPHLSHHSSSTNASQNEDNSLLSTSQKQNLASDSTNPARNKKHLRKKLFRKSQLPTLDTNVPRDQSQSNRIIQLNQPISKRKNYPANIVSNNKYNPITFVPKVLYSQFKYFLNLYFLLVALSQFIPQLKIGIMFTYIGPLVFVLLITMLQEYHDDYLIRKRDKQANSQTYLVMRREFGGEKLIPSNKILVGDLIILNKNTRVPADILLLKTNEENGSCFIRTDQLDGETDWKHRAAVSLTQQIENFEDFLKIKGSACVELPHKDIYSFTGTFDLDSLDTQSEFSTDPLNQGNSGHTPLFNDISTKLPRNSTSPTNGNSSKLEPQNTSVGIDINNTLWKDSTLATGRAVGLVIYTGKQTRSEMNTSIPRNKVGILDQEVNYLTKLLFIVTLIISFLLVLLDGFRGNWFISCFRFLILFSSIIPISLRVNLEMGKAYYCRQITKDKSIKGAVVRNSMIPEELGRLEYIVTDKTGTLTKNEMQLVRIHLGSISYSDDTMDEVSKLLKSYNKTMLLKKDESKPNTSKINSNNLFEEVGYQNSDGYNYDDSEPRMNQTLQTFKVVESLALCHNVTPTFGSGSNNNTPKTSLSLEYGSDSENINHNTFRRSSVEREREMDTFFEDHDINEIAGYPQNLEFNGYDEDHTENRTSKDEQTPQKMEYSASSPDEIAIVEWTNKVGLTLTNRTSDSKEIQLDLFGSKLEYDVLEVIPFTSESKRMGVIVRSRLSNELSFIMKGADSVMTKLIVYNDWVEEEVSNMAREGLRTLIVGRKVLSEQYYNEYRSEMDLAKLNLQNRNHYTSKIIADFLEFDLQVVCVTGVEDKLQDDVQTTLEQMRNAGFRIWMLTGDKIETAICVSISSKLVEKNCVFHVISNAKQQSDLSIEFSQLRSAIASGSNIDGRCLVIDGQSLQVCLSGTNTVISEFIELSSKLNCVVCCRCSPTQKGEIVKLIQQYTKKTVLAIGDGGNDVGMIQLANVGIGLAGKEGQQASLASDFAITEFSHLGRLVLWHGRNSYKQSCKLSHFVIHRGLIISFMQFVFSQVQCFFFDLNIFTFSLQTSLTLCTMYDISKDSNPEIFNDIKYGLPIPNNSKLQELCLILPHVFPTLTIPMRFFEFTNGITNRKYPYYFIFSVLAVGIKRIKTSRTQQDKTLETLYAQKSLELMKLDKSFDPLIIWACSFILGYSTDTNDQKSSNKAIGKQ